MKTKIEIEQNILEIIMKIHGEFPELSKYISEMPDNNSISNANHIDKRSFEKYWSSLDNILSAYAKTHLAQNGSSNKAMIDYPGYPIYPASEDIYSKNKKEMELNPENPLEHKNPNHKPGSMNEKEFEDDMSGDDLDVPGSELDDQMEEIGSEDEENNYYSLGGDNHNDLDEN
ncbi:MAG: hypothetical protein ACOVP5_01680 [Chitinophagales bacterium]